MKHPQWSTLSSTRHASISVENFLDNDNSQLEDEEHALPTTIASEFEGRFEDEESEESTRSMDIDKDKLSKISHPMDIDQDDSDKDSEVETRVFLF